MFARSIAWSGSDAALRMRIIAANDQDFDKMKALTVDCFGAGHSTMRGFRNPRGDDPVRYRLSLPLDALRRRLACVEGTAALRVAGAGRLTGPRHRLACRDGYEVRS